MGHGDLVSGLAGCEYSKTEQGTPGGTQFLVKILLTFQHHTVV
jgi:hypothetical protein